NGVSYSLDWSSNQSEVILVKNINQNKMVYPFRISPWIRMLSCDDGSEKYGGSGDEVSDHRLNISCEWECSLPTHVGLIASKEPTFSTKPIDSFLRRDVRLQIDLDVGYEYMIPFDNPETGELESTSKVRSVIFQSFTGTNTADSTAAGQNVAWQETVYFKDKYNYTVTQDDYDKIHSDPPENFIVNLIDDVIDPYKLRIYGRYGLMTRDYHWKINSPGEIEFIGTYLDSLKVGDNIWFAVYE
ncbi:MAG: hypothetical protein GX638_09465, partial [Crenarchaeota archaeon]|nr:hypothetical protein [Thermoproteota archaeon]